MSRSKLPVVLRTLHEVAERSRDRDRPEHYLRVLDSAAQDYAREVAKARKARKASGGAGRCGVCGEPVESAATGRPRKYHDECYSLRREELA